MKKENRNPFFLGCLKTKVEGFFSNSATEVLNSPICEIKSNPKKYYQVKVVIFVVIKAFQDEFGSWTSTLVIIENERFPGRVTIVGDYFGFVENARPRQISLNKHEQNLGPSLVRT